MLLKAYLCPDNVQNPFIFRMAGGAFVLVISIAIKATKKREQFWELK